MELDAKLGAAMSKGGHSYSTSANSYDPLEASPLEEDYSSFQDYRKYDNRNANDWLGTDDSSKSYFSWTNLFLMAIFMWGVHYLYTNPGHPVSMWLRMHAQSQLGQELENVTIPGVDMN